MPAPIVRSVVDDIGDVLDRLFPAPEERAKAELARHEIVRLPVLRQIDRAEERALFVAGWRPTIGWICDLPPKKWTPGYAAWSSACSGVRYPRAEWSR